MNATSTYHHVRSEVVWSILYVPFRGVVALTLTPAGARVSQDSAFGAPSDVPLFVRGVEDPGGMGGGDGYADDGSDAHELRESQRRVAEASARGDEASARSLALELELEAQALKRMGLEKELNDVHREHSKQMAAKQQAHDQLRNDFEKLQHYNLKLREVSNPIKARQGT